MKAWVKNSISYFLFAAVLTVIFTSGCDRSVPNPQSDPLAGWKALHGRDEEKVDETIKSDYQDYIQKLPTKDNNSVGPIFLYEDGTGRHAVSMEIFVKGENASWKHLIIYDKENKRIKAIKYGYGRYQS